MSPRRRLLIIALLVVLPVSAFVLGERAVVGRYAEVDLRELIEVGSRLPHHAGMTLESSIERYQDDPGVTATRSDLCSGLRCTDSWVLVNMGQDPDDYSVQAKLIVRAERMNTGAQAVWRFHRGPDRGWRPYDSEEHQVNARDISEHASAASLTCYSYHTHVDEDQDCLWSYYARYGQYTLAVLYGSDEQPISRDVFLREYVTPIDAYFAELLGINTKQGSTSDRSIEHG